MNKRKSFKYPEMYKPVKKFECGYKKFGACDRMRCKTLTPFKFQKCMGNEKLWLDSLDGSLI